MWSKPTWKDVLRNSFLGYSAGKEEAGSEGRRRRDEGSGLNRTFTHTYTQALKKEKQKTKNFALANCQLA